MKTDEQPLFRDWRFIVFIIVTLAFLAIKVNHMWFKFSDEGIYFYMAKLLLGGEVPYRDFFSTNMPMQLSIIAFFLSIVGEKIILLKLLPILASIISSVFIFLLVRKRFNSLCALASSTFYLFSFVVLATTDHSTGVHLTTMFIVIGCYLIYREKYLLSGIVLSLALMTRLYAAFALIGLLIYLALKQRNGLIKFLAGIIIIILPVNIILLLIFKGDYLTSVFLYHLLKSEGIAKLNILKFFLRWDFLFILLSAFALFIKGRKKLLLPFIVAAAIGAFYMFYADIYYLYLAMLVPFLAMLAGCSLERMAGRLPKAAGVIIVLLILAIVATHNSIFYIKDHAYTAKIDFIDDIVKYVKENSNTGDTIYGSFEITPLVALLSGRRIASNYIDTNEKTFLTGLYDVGKRTESLKGNVKFVLMKMLVDPAGKVIQMENIIDPDFLRQECNATKTYWIKKDYSSNALVVFDCSLK